MKGCEIISKSSLFVNKNPSSFILPKQFFQTFKNAFSSLNDQHVQGQSHCRDYELLGARDVSDFGKRHQVDQLGFGHRQTYVTSKSQKNVRFVKNVNRHSSKILVLDAK